ncbi:MAG: RND family transporter [Bernardetiaceae bacterium]
MWLRIADFILRFRLFLLVGLFLMTALMGYFGQRAQMSYEFIRAVPESDPEMQYFRQFQSNFGIDDNFFALGIEDPRLYELSNFLAFQNLAQQIEALEGVGQMLALPTLPYLTTSKQKNGFTSYPLFKEAPQSQAELDSLLALFRQITFYEGQLFNAQSGATMAVAAIEEATLNSQKRTALVQTIESYGMAFSKETGIEIHYAGLPYVRTKSTTKVKAELNVFLAGSVLITALVLFFFFRSFAPVFYPLLVIGMVVVWTLGTIGILGFKISMLTGLLPSILVVIGIPNCVYLMNKYHQEYKKSLDQREALRQMIRRIGAVTLITNATTATGFLVLVSTRIPALQEFGVVAGINIFHTFLISIIFIPAVFSYLPPPRDRQIKHLRLPAVQKLLQGFYFLISHRSAWVYGVTLLVVIASGVGLSRLRPLSFMVDDLPENSRVVEDLAFFERNFRGVMPLEIVVDLGKPQAHRLLRKIKQVEALEDAISEKDYLSPSLSLTRFYKAIQQARYNYASPDYFMLPKKQPEHQALVAGYERALKDGEKSVQLLESFIDSTRQYLRLSYKIADVGSERLQEIIDEELNPLIQEQLAADSTMSAHVTGTTRLFIQGNQYLIASLGTSLLLACLIVALIMGMLFRNLRMVVISLIPNLIPLIATAGLMGYFGVPLKPSTALIFSIAFGISVDDSIHFLAKFRQEMLINGFNRKRAIAISLKETGTSMIYTSIILFAGFVVFIASDFGGTVALGWLTSTTLLLAMFTNLILLPILLRTFGIGKNLQKAKAKTDKKEESVAASRG